MRRSARGPSSQSLIRRGRAPAERALHGIGFINSELSSTARDEQGIILRGPTRPSQGWRTPRWMGHTRIDQFAVDWDQQQGHWPQGHLSVAWWEHEVARKHRPIMCGIPDKQTCGDVSRKRPCCTRAKHTAEDAAATPGPVRGAASGADLVMPARRAAASIKDGPASKGRSPRVCAFGLRRTDIGAWRRPTCSTSPSPPRSISTALWRGSTTTHGALGHGSPRFAALAPANADHRGEAAA